MSITTYYTATSLDDFIADDHHSLEWLFRQGHDGSGRLNYHEFFARVGAVVIGSPRPRNRPRGTRRVSGPTSCPSG